jgi:hypothetical protein
MPKSENEKLAAEVFSLHKELDKLRDKAYGKGLRHQGEILNRTGRVLEEIGQYDRAEAPER